MEKRLYRSRIHKVFGGVCGGLANYFNMDVVLVRLLYALGLLFGCGFFFLLYIALWIVAPLEPIVHIVEPIKDEPIKDGYQPTDNLDTSNPPNDQQK